MGLPAGPAGPSRVRDALTATLYCGNATEVLQRLPEASVQCCVTSPPYWGLRDYGVTGQLGAEATPDAYVDALVQVLTAVHRVLHPTGTLWLNLGDTYASSWPCRRRSLMGNGALVDGRRPARPPRLGGDLKDKDLAGIPWLVALRLRAQGWWLRRDIIWQKPNPMPESVTDRPTTAHEYLFLLTKSERYYYDAQAIAEPLAPTSEQRLAQDVEAQRGSARGNGGQKTNGPMKAVGGRRKRSGNLKRDIPGARDGRGIPNNHLGRSIPWEDQTGRRTARSVWTIPVQPYKGAHFATFPPELARRCIAAGSKPGDTVLDPFGGSGTVAQVAVSHGRDSVYIDLNPAYLELARQRIGPLLVR